MGAAPAPFAATPKRASIEWLEKAQAQARVQRNGRLQNRFRHETLPLTPAQGLLRLPAPSPGDIFFDLEGDPTA